MILTFDELNLYNYGDQNQFNVLQLPHAKFENFNLSRFGMLLTNNKIEKIEYLNEGGSPLSKSNIEFSNYFL